MHHGVDMALTIVRSVRTQATHATFWGFACRDESIMRRVNQGVVSNSDQDTRTH